MAVAVAVTVTPAPSRPPSPRSGSVRRRQLGRRTGHGARSLPPVGRADRFGPSVCRRPPISARRSAAVGLYLAAGRRVSAVSSAQTGSRAGRRPPLLCSLLPHSLPAERSQPSRARHSRVIAQRQQSTQGSAQNSSRPWALSGECPRARFAGTRDVACGVMRVGIGSMMKFWDEVLGGRRRWRPWYWCGASQETAADKSSGTENSETTHAPNGNWHCYARIAQISFKHFNFIYKSQWTKQCHLTHKQAYSVSKLPSGSMK